MDENGEIHLVVDGTEYTVIDEKHDVFTITQGDENFAEIGLSPCCEYYTYDYSSVFANPYESGGTSFISDHESILNFFAWVIGQA